MFRRSPRALALWAGALVVAVITAVVVASDLAALHRRAARLGPEQNALVATRDLAAGTMLQRDDLAVRRVHRSQLPAGVVADRDTARGRVVAVPVLRGAFVASRNLAPRRRTGLDGIVPEGMRAIRVEVSSALRLRAGSAVDVLASFDTTADDTGSTVVVAAGALVLATDTGGAGGTGRTNATGVTLLVDSDEAHDLADAQAHAVVSLALVPPEEAARPVPGLRR